jgi:hypothetical protein
MEAREPSLAELRAVAEHAALRVAFYRRRTYLARDLSGLRVQMQVLVPVIADGVECIVYALPRGALGSSSSMRTCPRSSRTPVTRPRWLATPARSSLARLPGRVTWTTIALSGTRADRSRRLRAHASQSRPRPPSTSAQGLVQPALLTRDVHWSSSSTPNNAPHPPRSVGGLLARRDTPIVRGRGAATRNELPAAGLGQPPRPSAELRDAGRQPLGLQRQQRGHDELNPARPRLGAPPGDRNAANRLGIVGVLGVAQGHQDRSLLNRHQARDCNRRSRQRPLACADQRQSDAHGARSSTPTAHFQ